MAADVERELGRLDERTGNHAERLDRIEAKLDHVITVIDRAGGSWKALVAAGSIAAGLTAAAGWVIEHLGGKQ